MKNKHITLVAALGFLLLLGGWAIYAMTRPATTDSATAAAQAGAALIDASRVRASDHVMGNPRARVVVIEYASPSCTHCASWNNEIKPLLKEAYIDTGKIQFVYRFYLIQRFPQDPDVARMATCLPREQFMPFMDMMYRNHPEWNKYAYPDVADANEALLRMGRLAGMSEERVNQCRQPNPAVDNELNSVAMAGDAAFGVGTNGTPTLVVNGQVTDGSFASLSAAIDAALAK